MDILEVNGHTINRYSSPTEMDAERFSVFQINALIDSGVGTDQEGIDAHYAKCIKFVETDNKDEVIKELSNMRVGHALIQAGVNLKNKTFACLVHSIDEEVYTDISDNGIKTIIDKLKCLKISQGQINAALEDSKKKLNPN